MEGYSRKDEGCPQLLDLIPKEKEWLTKSGERRQTSHGCSDEKQLELRLGPPNGGDWNIKNKNTFSYVSPWSSSSGYQVKTQQQTTPFLQAHGQLKEPSKPNCTIAEKKTVSAANNNTAVPNSSSAQKRTAPTPVVGWPPIRSFRKNLASGSSSKPVSDSQNVVGSKSSSEKPIENSPKSLLVKINMDGVPIGRKVDLKEHDSYEKLSSAVDELFRGLLAAQSNFSTGGIKNEEDGGKAITGLLDGSGEYTLVYEDNEGDRLLIGDVPWHYLDMKMGYIASAGDEEVGHVLHHMEHIFIIEPKGATSTMSHSSCYNIFHRMFVSSVKRLRVLKSSELPTLCRGRKHGKLS